MKKFILSIAAALCLPLTALAGEISMASVPGNLNYQGRLERDNAPITGPVHLYFRIFNVLTGTGGGTCGAAGQSCLWESPEVSVLASQGIFSADLTPPLTVFAGGQKLYLEVQVESDTLSPREPLNSVAYALAAKKLEDGASVSVTTLTAAYQVLLATSAGSNVGIGTNNPVAGSKVTVDGWLRIASGGIIFPDNSSMSASSVGSAGNIASVGDADILADSDVGGDGDIIFRKPGQDFLRITNSGKVGIGSIFTTDGGGTPPLGKLDVNGSLYVGNEGIYDRLDAEVNIKEDLVVEGGQVRGAGNNYVSIGETANTIIAGTDNAPRLWLDASGNLGVGAAATASERIHSNGNIRANSGLRGGLVSAGGYSGWTSAPNEVRAQDGSHLLLQQNTPFNVGIGTDTPREKLHVRGSILADKGVIASTGVFTGQNILPTDIALDVRGNFKANTGQGNTINLSSTVIYGTLQVTAGITSITGGIPAYLTSTQTFTGQTTFANQVTVSSELATRHRLGVGMSSYDFPGDRYLQVGDKDLTTTNNANIYLVAGSTAEAKINFYRAATVTSDPPVEMARLETMTGSSQPNLALVISGKARTLTDSTYHRIQNSVLWVSTGYASTPSIFVSSSLGIVGIGTAVSDPNWRLTVDGNMRFPNPGTGIFFENGTSITGGGLGGLSVGAITNNGDALVQSDVDQFAGGDVILRAGSVDGLILKSGGNVGIGTVNPSSKLNVRGGDLVLGTPVNPYGGDAVEDLVVGGNIAFDGELLQRSASAVNLSKLVVGGDVYLSTGAGKRTGIGNILPGYTLDVTGDINASGSLLTGNTIRISNTGTVGSGGLNAAWDGAVIDVNRGGTGVNTITAGGILFGNGTADIGNTGVLGNGQLMIGDGSGEPTVATLTQASANRVVITNAAGSITLSLPQDIHSGATPTFSSLSLTNPLSVGNGGTGVNTLAAGGILYGSDAADIGATAVLGNGQLLIGDGSGVPTLATLTQASANRVVITNAAGSITLSLPQDIHTAAVPQFAGVTAAYIRPAANGVAALQIRRADGTTNILDVDSTNNRIGINTAAPDTDLHVNGNIKTVNFQMTSGGTADYILRSDASGNASWIDPATGGLGDNVVGNEVKDTADTTLTRSGSGTSVAPWKLALNLGKVNTWTANQIFTSSIAAVILSTVGVNDYARVMGGDTNDNAGYLELATADDGDEPIYVRQYTGVFATLTRTATLLNAAGDTSFPGTVTAPTFSGAFSGNATNVTGVVATANGGTGSGVVATARANLVAAKSGANSDITSLSALSTALSIGQGGTGSTAIASGLVRSNGTALSGAATVAMATEVSGQLAVPNGGTGRNTFTADAVLIGNGGSNINTVTGVAGVQVYSVARTTTTTGSPCNNWTFTNGILTNVSGNVACP